MLLIVVASAIVIPNYLRHMEAARLDTSARRLLSCFLYARSQAIIRNAPYRLNVEQDGQRYWVTCYDADQADQGQDPFRADTSTLGLPEELPEGVTFEQVLIGDESRQDAGSTAAQTNDDGSLFIEFRPDGTCDGAHILIKGSRDERLALRADALTGRAEIAQEAKQ
jgi:Tfp pilus assembly protein FimT